MRVILLKMFHPNKVHVVCSVSGFANYCSILTLFSFFNDKHHQVYYKICLLQTKLYSLQQNIKCTF